MTTRQRVQFCVAGVLLAGTLPGGWSSAAVADFDEQLHGIAREIAGGAAKGRMHRLAVEPFADLEGRVTQTGRLLAAELTAELATDRAIQVIDQRQVAAYLETRKASLLSGLSRRELSQASKELGLDGIVAGSVVESANQVRLTVKLIAVKNGSLVAATKTTLPKTGLLAELAGPVAEPSLQLRGTDPTPAQSAASQPPEGMVLVQAGPFIYGEGDQQRTVTLPAFWMDVFEVTYGRYAEFRAFNFDLLQSHHPMTSISWHQARRYCLAQGKRLPTEQEWEKAARGTDGRLYPWGNAYDLAFVNAENRHRSPTDVGKFEEGRSPYGLYDMAGNVSEWTESGNDAAKVFRGGSWASPQQDVRTVSKNALAPAQRLVDLGFRCAKDGPG